MINLQSDEAWAIILSLLVVLTGSVTGLSKWNHSRTDAAVLNCMEERARKPSGNRLQSLGNIAQPLDMSEKRVMAALTRLHKVGKVRQHGENWVLI